MDSQVTLVRPAPPKKYYFSHNSVKKTSLYLSTVTPSAPTYVISTDLETDKRTEFKDANGNVLAVWTRKDILPDTIAWPAKDSGSTSVSKWLKKVEGADGTPVHTLTTPAGSIIFRSSAKHRVGAYISSTLASSPSVDEAEAIAYLALNANNNNPEIVLNAPAQAEDVEDQVVVAILMLEHKLRMTDTSISVGGGKFEQNRTIAGYYVST